MLTSLSILTTDPVTHKISFLLCGKPVAGQQYTLWTGDSNIMTIQVNGTFSDGKQQILFFTRIDPPSISPD
jgi:hypothetical protein